MRAVSPPNNVLAFRSSWRDAGAILGQGLRWAACLTRSKPAKVWLVGAGPGDPELLTIRALKLLRSAQAVAYDHLVGDEILQLISPTAEKICVGKRAGRHSMPQHEINARLIELAYRYKRVVRLKGGDPGLFARTGEEISALAHAGLDYEIVPGITAALGCAAAAGVPLTERGIAHSVHFVAGHLCGEGAREIEWARLADSSETLVFYMARAALMHHATKLIEHGLPARMPVMIVRDGTKPSQTIEHLTLADCASGFLENFSGAPALVVIGNVVRRAASGAACGREAGRSRSKHRETAV